MAHTLELQQKIALLQKERDAYANALTMSNSAFMDKVKEFSIVKRIAESIGWSLDLRQICTELVNLIIDETTAENCSLWLVDASASFIILTTVRGQNNAEAKYFDNDSQDLKKMEVGRGAAGWVALHGESLLIKDVNKSPYFVHLENRNIMSIMSLLCLPIKGKDGILGVLNLSHPDIGVFSKENERVLQLITDQAGIVFTNYHLFQEIQELNKSLEQKIEDRTFHLRQSEDRYERAVISGKVGIWDWEVGKKHIYVAPNLKAMLGFKDHEISNSLKDWLRLIHPVDRHSLLKDILKGNNQEKPVYECECRMAHKDGHTMWFLLRGTVVRNEVGVITRLSGSHTDITQRKNAEQKLLKVQEEALAHARAAGKAEFATTVLHNIGNVLNSVNVNGIEIRKTLQKFRINQLLMALKMIEDHKSDLASFFGSDKKGIQLPLYLAKMGKLMGSGLISLQEISEDINSKVELMRDIIETQQADAKNKSELESRDLVQLVEESLKIQMESIKKHQINLEKNYRYTQSLFVAPSKFIHVLVNLIKNAIEAMLEVPYGNRIVFLETGRDEQNRTYLKIGDTGAGIATEDLKKMFTRGFTTKKNGHGFGLHYCANAVEDMGGEISVYSEGFGQGASFTLVFPPVK